MEVQEDNDPQQVQNAYTGAGEDANEVIVRDEHGYEQSYYIIPDVDIEVVRNFEDNEDDPLSPVSSVVSELTTDNNEENSNQLPNSDIVPDEQPNKANKRSHSDVEDTYDDDDDDDGKLCPICYDNWTNVGPHRLCSLKCGHLFGLSCLTRWLDTQRRKTCPSCKKHVSRNDIRYIYAKKVIAVDTQIVETLKKQIVDINCEKLQLQTELNKLKCRESLLMQEVDNLKKHIAGLNTRKATVDSNVLKAYPQRSNAVKLYKDKSLDLSTGCRVFDVNVRLNTIAVSSKSNNALFAGYGIRKVTISDYKLTTFLPLHSDAIRDVAFHPENNCLLTASLDKSCKYIDCSTNSSAITVGCGVELWSCCWDCINTNIFYVGTRQGSIFKYDIRQTANYVSVYNVPGDMSPVVSVSSSGISSLLSCKLSSLWHFNQNDNNTATQLPIDGPFISMRCEAITKQILVSSRPSVNFPYTRHTLFNIDKSAQCNITHTFSVDSKPNFMSRSCFIMNNSNDYIAAHSEKDKCVILWSINTGNKVTTIPAYDPVLDLCSFKLLINDEHLLVSLTEKKLDFFKFTKSNT